MYVIGTAGHVDHGKSALVKALTGTDPDRWEEEKARGLTIDLGFAEITLPSGRTASIIDVPGHERFIKNMLAGAAGIDLVLLVIAADGGVMPQTREHLAIVDFLGVQAGVIAITRCDLVDDDMAALAATEARDLVEGTPFEDAPIVACSAVTGTGLDSLLDELDRLIATVAPGRDLGRPRLPIDRAFSMAGFGTVVTGTLLDGSLRIGQTVELLPPGLKARVRGIQNHGRSAEVSEPATRTALNLSGVSPDQLARGMVVALPGQQVAATKLDVRLRPVPYLERPIRHNLNVTVHTGAAEAPARLSLLDADSLRPEEECWGQLRLTVPVVASRGDRFVIRDSNGTLGGGHVVDVDPPRHRRHHVPTIEALEVKDRGTPEERLLAFVEEHQPVSPDRLGEAEFASFPGVIQTLTAQGRLVIASGPRGDDLLYTRWGYDAAVARLTDLLTRQHADAPLRPGMPRGELAQRLNLGPRQADVLLQHLSETGLVEDGEFVAMAGHRPALSPDQASAADAYLERLRSNPHAPPTDVPIDASLRAYLVDSGAVIDAGGGVVFAADAFAEMAERVLDQIRSNGTITLAEVRDMFGTTRKYAQPLLETMDRRHLTRRVGDERVLY